MPRPTPRRALGDAEHQGGERQADQGHAGVVGRDLAGAGVDPARTRRPTSHATAPTGKFT